MALAPTRCLFWICLSLMVCAARADDGNSSDTFSGDGFANNLFTDVTPLLALFGERFALQFLSECYNWKDHALFAMAPVGAVTALICAIRVGGPNLLRTVIGRARESIAEPELEFMSSLSEETCELWNGNAVVRVSGSSTVKEIIHVPAYPRDISPESFVTLESGTQEEDYKLEQVIDWSNESDLESILDRNRKSSETSDMPPNISLNCHGKITLWEPWLYALLATLIQIGVIVWSGVVCFSLKWKERLPSFEAIPGFYLLAVGTLLLTISMWLCAQVIDQGTVERAWVRRKTERRLDRNVGRPPPICTSNIEEYSQREDKSHSATLSRADAHTTPILRDEAPILNTKSEDNVNIYWVQGSSEEGSGSFLLRSQHRNKIVTSHRNSSLNGAQNVKEQQHRYPIDPSNDQRKSSVKIELKTSIAVVLGVFGFFAQFEGLRLVNWSCSIAQLIALTIITFLRGLARRAMVSQPIATAVTVGHELDNLVLELFRGNGHPDFTFNFTDDFAYSIQNKVSGTDAQKALNLRIRLAQITRWKGAKYEEALCLAKAIEVAIEKLNPFFDLDYLENCATVWLRVYTGHGNEDISLDLVRDDSKSTVFRTTFTVCVAQLEAALSLAEYCIRENYLSDDTENKATDYFKTKDWMRPPPADSLDTYFQVVGLREYALVENLYWWTKLPTQLIIDGAAPQNDRELRLGFWGFVSEAETNKKSLVDTVEPPAPTKLGTPPNLLDKAVRTYALKLPKEQALAIHIFSAVIWAIAKIPQLITPTLRPADLSDCSLSEPDLQDAVLRRVMHGPLGTVMVRSRFHFQQIHDIVTEVQKLGIGDRNTLGVFLGIVAPMSHAGQLPNEFVVEDFLSRTLSDEVLLNWSVVFGQYSSLLFQVQTRGKQDRFAKRAIAAVLEFVLQVAEEPLQTKPWSRNTNEIGALIDELRRGIRTRDVVYNTLVWLGTVYRQQRRGERYKRAMTTLLGQDWRDLEQHESPPEEDSWEFLGDKDALGWSLGCCKLFQQAKQADVDPENVEVPAVMGNFTDYTGQTILHHFVSDLTEQEFKRIQAGLDRYLCTRLSGSSSFNSPGRNGQQPLHRAAATGNDRAVNYLLNNGADMEATDNAGRTALFLAAWNGHLSVCETLLERGRGTIDINRHDNCEQNALHMAARNRKQYIMQLLLKQEGIEINFQDRWGQTALHLVAMNGSFDGVVFLLRKESIQPIYQTQSNKTAQDLAQEAGHKAIVKRLAVYIEDPKNFSKRVLWGDGLRKEEEVD